MVTMAEKICKTCEGKGWVSDPNATCEDCNGAGLINDGKPKKPSIPVPGRFEGDRVLLSRKEHDSISKRMSDYETRLTDAEIRRDNEISRRLSLENHSKHEIELERQKAKEATNAKNNAEANMRNMQKNVDNMYILDRKCKDLEIELNIKNKEAELIAEKIRYLMETIMDAQSLFGHHKTIPEFIKAMQETVNKQVLLRNEQIEKLKDKKIVEDRSG